jgi:3-oxoacyl-(acyl-carrier-protein) synthase
MKRVVITGLGLIAPTGVGREAFRSGLASGKIFGEEVKVLPGKRGSRPIRVAGVAGFDPADFIDPRKLRRMSPESRMVTSSILLAFKDAGADKRQVEPEQVGTFLGSGFGSLTTTGEYLRGLHDDGMAGVSPFLFSESLASSPLGHAAIALDARGPSMAFAGGDGSILSALSEGWRAIRTGRIQRAICCGFELFSPELWSLLARLAVREDRTPFLADGAVSVVLEEARGAASTDAPVLAQLDGMGQAGDPRARPTAWSNDPGTWQASLEQAVSMLDEPIPATGCFVRHVPPTREGADAELKALQSLLPGWQEAPPGPIHPRLGNYGAAGGFTLAAAILHCAGSGKDVVLSNGSWGGSTGAALIRPPAA